MTALTARRSQLASNPLRGPAAIVAAATAIAALVAVAVIVLDACTSVRALMPLRLPARSGSWHAALSIYTHNLAVAAIPLLAATAVGRPQGPTLRWRRTVDALLATILAVNAARVGAAAGAYGLPLIRYLALHGPLELSAFAIAAVPYLRARSDPGQAGPIVGRAALVCAALLALAAVLEVRRGLT